MQSFKFETLAREYQPLVTNLKSLEDTALIGKQQSPLRRLFAGMPSVRQVREIRTTLTALVLSQEGGSPRPDMAEYDTDYQGRLTSSKGVSLAFLGNTPFAVRPLGKDHIIIQEASMSVRNLSVGRDGRLVVLEHLLFGGLFDFHIDYHKINISKL